MRIVFLLFCCLPAALWAQVPTPDSFLGHPLGERYARTDQIVAYCYALQAAAPSRLQVLEYGKTYEGRPLVAVVVAPGRLGALETLRQNHLRHLGVAEGTPQGEDTPIAWLSFGIHGNEASSPDAALKLLYELAAGTNPVLEQVLGTTVVIVDPCVNPDGRSRFVQYTTTRTGRTANAHPWAWEQDEPWPTGRSNHYLYDLNRDWAWQTQRESQARGALYQQWLPHLHADYHEMGSESNYYFLPAAAPYHTALTPWQIEAQRLLGAKHQASFDANGWRYFTREVFDLLYPSYGDTWPIYQGAVGMTYEQAGQSGTRYRQRTGDTLTLTARLTHHYTTAINTLQLVHEQRTRFVAEQQAFYRRTLERAPGTYSTYLVKATNDPAQLGALRQLLDRHGIRYEALTAAGAKRVQGFSYATGATATVALAAGDWVISTRQPKGTLVHVLFEPETALADSNTYDLTAWALPYAFGLEAYALPGSAEAQPTASIGTPAPATATTLAPWAFAVPTPGLSNGLALAKLLKLGCRPYVLTEPVTLEGKPLPTGSIWVQEADPERQAQAAAAVGALAVPLRSTAVTQGPDLGSSTHLRLLPSRVALLAGEEVDTHTFGDVWHFFDEVAHYPLTLVPTTAVTRVNWNDFDVLILPGGNIEDVFEGRALTALEDWIRRGGRVVALGEALSLFAGRKGYDLKAVKADEDTSTTDIPYRARSRSSLSQTIAGAIYAAQVDTTHPLGFGVGSPYFSLRLSDSPYHLLPEGGTVARYSKGSLRAGFVGATLKPTLEGTLAIGAVGVGRGHVVYLPDSPVFRGFWVGGQRLLLNAVFYHGY